MESAQLRAWLLIKTQGQFASIVLYMSVTKGYQATHPNNLIFLIVPWMIFSYLKFFPVSHHLTNKNVAFFKGQQFRAEFVSQMKNISK